MGANEPISHKQTGNGRCASCQANEGDVGILFTRKTLVGTNKFENHLKTKQFTIIENAELDSNKNIFINRIYSPIGAAASERFNSIEVYNNYNYSDQYSNTTDDNFTIHQDLDKQIRFMKTTLRKGYLYIYSPPKKEMICYRISDKAIVNKINGKITNVNQISEMENKSTCSSCQTFSMDKIIIFLTKEQFNDGSFYFKFSDCYWSEENLNFYKDEKNIQKNMSFYNKSFPKELKDSITSILDFNPIRYTWYDSQWYDFKNNQYKKISESSTIQNRPKVIDQLLQYNTTATLISQFQNDSEFSNLVYAHKSSNINLREILKAYTLNNIKKASNSLFEVCVDDRTGFMLDLASHSEYLYQNEFKDKVHPSYITFPLLDNIETVASDVELFKYFSEIHSAEFKSAVFKNAEIKQQVFKNAKFKQGNEKDMHRLFNEDLLITKKKADDEYPEAVFLSAQKNNFTNLVQTPRSITLSKCAEHIKLLFKNYSNQLENSQLNDFISSTKSSLSSRIQRLYFSDILVDDMVTLRKKVRINLDLTQYNYLEHKVHTYLFANSHSSINSANLKKNNSYNEPKKFYTLHLASENMIENELFSRKFHLQLNSIFNFANENKSKSTIQLLNENLFSSIIRNIISKFSPRSSITKGIRNYLNFLNDDNAKENTTSLNPSNKKNNDIVKKFKIDGYLCNMLTISNEKISPDEKMIKFNEKNIFLYAFLTCQTQLLEQFIITSQTIRKNSFIKKIIPEKKMDLQKEIIKLIENIKKEIKIYKTIKKNSLTWKTIMHFYLLLPPNNLIGFITNKEDLNAYDLLSYALTGKVTVNVPKANTHSEYAVKISLTEDEFIKNSDLDEALNTILNNRGLPLLEDIIPRLSDFISGMTCINLITDAFEKQELSEDSFSNMCTKIITTFKGFTDNAKSFNEINYTRSLDIRLNLVSGIVYHAGSVLFSSMSNDKISNSSMYKSSLIIAINFGLLFIKHPLAQIGLSILYSLVDSMFKDNNVSLPTQLSNIMQKFRSFGNKAELTDYYEFINMFKKLHDTHRHFLSLKIDKENDFIETYKLIGSSSQRPYTLSYFFNTYTAILRDSPAYAPQSATFFKIDTEHQIAQRYIIFKDILAEIKDFSQKGISLEDLKLNETPEPIK